MAEISQIQVASYGRQERVHDLSERIRFQDGGWTIISASESLGL